jgi:hypothetical protein
MRARRGRRAENRISNGKSPTIFSRNEGTNYNKGKSPSIYKLFSIFVSIEEK